ncbi:hypothetical protein [Plesiomonas shigelloides]|nr:hypothetical protein [Plesiomonas shigelloides]MCX2497123.1 hypothetical protein [Plesiomonas shigelloides]
MLKDDCNWRGLMLTMPMILLVGCAPVLPNSGANWQAVKVGRNGGNIAR